MWWHTVLSAAPFQNPRSAHVWNLALIILDLIWLQLVVKKKCCCAQLFHGLWEMTTVSPSHQVYIRNSSNGLSCFQSHKKGKDLHGQKEPALIPHAWGSSCYGACGAIAFWVNRGCCPKQLSHFLPFTKFTLKRIHSKRKFSRTSSPGRATQHYALPHGIGYTTLWHFITVLQSLRQRSFLPRSGFQSRGRRKPPVSPLE